jgi:hypothetical protein
VVLLTVVDVGGSVGRGVLAVVVVRRLRVVVVEGVVAAGCCNSSCGLSRVHFAFDGQSQRLYCAFQWSPPAQYCVLNSPKTHR